MESKIKENISSLFEKTSDYLETRADLYKLKAVDKTSDVLSTVIAKLVVLFVFVMFIIMMNIGIALILGVWTGRFYDGFFILAGFYLIAGFIIYLQRKKWLKGPISNRIIQELLN